MICKYAEQNKVNKIYKKKPESRSGFNEEVNWYLFGTCNIQRKAV